MCRLGVCRAGGVASLIEPDEVGEEGEEKFGSSWADLAVSDF